MKNVVTAWSKEKAEAMECARGPIAGIVAILVSERLGDGYSAVAGGKSVDALLDLLPPSIGVYATMPSCSPEKIVAAMEFPWNDEHLSSSPYTVESEGIIFRRATPDNRLCDIRTTAWELFAEQEKLGLVEEWGRGLASATA